MPFNGIGGFTLVAGNPKVTGTTISSSVDNNTMTDFANGFANCMTRDGQSAALANIPMGGFKLTGLAAGTANGDAVRWEQAVLLTQLADDSSASLGSGLVGFDQSLNYAVGTIGWHAKEDAINVTDAPWLADKTGATDSHAAITAAEAFAFAAGKALYFPAGVYVSTDYLLIRVKAFGEGRANAWDGVDGGTLIRPSGAGTGRLWTDIDGTDAATFKPLIVLGRNYASLEDMTIDDGATAWSAAVFVPGTRRNALKRVDILGTWDAGGLYLDATWSKFNATLTALYPDVESDAGPLEFHADSCSLLGGLWGVRVEGTTRDPDSYVSDPTDPNGFVWGYGGASDMVFMACRISSAGALATRQAGGGSVRISARVKNTAKGVQTIWFHGCALRTNSKYTADLDKCNRIGFIGGYAETAASDLGFDAAFNVTTAAVADVASVQFVGFDHNGPIKLDDVQVASGPATYAWNQTRRLSIMDVSGEIKTPTINADNNAGCSLIGRASAGTWVMAADTGSGPVNFMVFDNTVTRPAVDATLDLGASGTRFRDLRLSRQIVLGTSVTISTGTGTPEGAVTANPGSIFLRTNGGAGTALYVKESGSGTNTGWVAK